MAILNKEKYMKYLEDYDLNHDQKIQYIETLWNAAHDIVLKQLGVHPIQKILEERENKKQQKEKEVNRTSRAQKKTGKKVIPEVGFMKLSTILKIFPVSRAEWYEGVKKGDYPKPVHLNKNTQAWKAQDIRELITKYEG